MNGPRIAVVGSGPSGFYAAEALLRADAQITVDMFERLPTPFGLVRGGVAPDHPKIKQVSLVYDRIAKAPRFRFFGNVSVGVDVPLQALREHYCAIVLAHGASVDRRLGIPGEDLLGCIGAADFVGWYNGHPDFSRLDFDLSHEVALVIGQGNVAADIARMLAIPAQALASTDITDFAARALAQSRIRDIYIVGRRGPAQAKFTSNELRELGEIPGCDPVVDAKELELNDASIAELATPQGEENARNVALMKEFAARARDAERRIHFRFLESPVAVEGQGGRAQAVVLARNRLEGVPFAQSAVPSGSVSRLACGVVFKCVGFRGTPLAGVPFDAMRAIVPNERGRVIESGEPVPGLYVAGWIKRGASGTIGTNRADSVETVKALLEDLGALQGSRPRGGAIEDLFKAHAVRAVDYGHWLRLDALEVERGRARGKPREKITEVSRMLDLA